MSAHYVTKTMTSEHLHPTPHGSHKYRLPENEERSRPEASVRRNPQHLPEKMAVSSDDGHSKYRLLFAFIMLFNISLSTSVSLDLTELRNKVSKIKVHPRGNLWATGHFMGKKSISSNQLQDSPFSSQPPRRNILGELSGSSEDLKELITEEMLKVALQAQLEEPKRTRDVSNQDSDFVIKLLKSYIENVNL